MGQHKVTVDCLFPNMAGGVGNVIVAEDAFTAPEVIDGDLVHGCATLKPLVRGTTLRVFVQQNSGENADYQLRFQCLKIAPYTGGLTAAEPLVSSVLDMASTNTFDEGTLEFTWGTSDGLTLTHDWTMTFLRVETVIGQGTSVPAVTCELRQNGTPIASVVSNPISGLFSIVPVNVDVLSGDVLTLGMLDIGDPFPELGVTAFGQTEDTVDVTVTELHLPWNPYV